MEDDGRWWYILSFIALILNWWNNKEKQGDVMTEFLWIENFCGDNNSLCNQENDDNQYTDWYK